MPNGPWATAIAVAFIVFLAATHTHANEVTGRTQETYQSPVPGTAYAGQIPVTVNGENVGYANIYQPVGADGRPQTGGAYSAISADSDLGRELQRAGASAVNGQIVLEQAGPNVGAHWTARPGEQPGANEYWRDAQIPAARGGGSIDVWYNLPPEPPPPEPEPEPEPEPRPPEPEPQPRPTTPTCGPNELNWFGNCIPLAPRTPEPAPAPAAPVQQTSLPEPEPEPPSTTPNPAPSSPAVTAPTPPSQSPPVQPSSPPSQPGSPRPEPSTSWQPVYTPRPRSAPSPTCTPQPDTRALFLHPVNSPLMTNTILEVTAQISGNVQGAVVAVTSWGTQQDMVYRDGAWHAALWVPSTLVGEQSVLVAAVLTADLGCGVVAGPNQFSGTAEFDVVSRTGQGETLPEVHGVPGIVMSLEQYVRSCLTVWAPGWCALSDRAALLLRQELASVATQYYTLMGRGKYIELVRRIEAILYRNGLTGQLDPVWLPEDLRREDLWSMQPLQLSD